MTGSSEELLVPFSSSLISLSLSSGLELAGCSTSSSYTLDAAGALWREDMKVFQGVLICFVLNCFLFFINYFDCLFFLLANISIDVSFKLKEEHLEDPNLTQQSHYADLRFDIRITDHWLLNSGGWHTPCFSSCRIRHVASRCLDFGLLL